MIIGGSSSSGKSYLTAKILKQRHLLFDCSNSPNQDPSSLKIYYCVPKGSRAILDKDLLADPQFNVHYGIPDVEEDIGSDAIIVLDDLMSEISQAGETILPLFTRTSHHHRISVIYLCQNLLYQGRNSTMRSLSLQSSYIIGFRNARDRRQLSVLAGQMFPRSSRFIHDVIADALSSPFTYLLFDLTQTCDDKLRIRTNILPDDSPRNIVYVDRNSLGE